MVDKPRIGVEVRFDNRDAVNWANRFGNLLSDTAKEWRDDIKRTTGEGFIAGMKIALASGKSGAAIRKFLDTNIVEASEKLQKALRQGNFEEVERMERILDNRVRRFQKEASAISDAFKHMQDRQARTFEEHADAFGDKVQKLHRGLFGGLGGFGDIIRTGGGAVQRFGREQQARGLRARELAVAEGKDAKGAERMAMDGKLIANIGKAAVGFAAVAGAILLLVKLFADLETKIKDANKEMMASAGAADFGLTHADYVTGKLTQRLDAMRKATTDLNDNFLKFRVAAEQQQKILSQFNEAGLTFNKLNQEISQGAKFMGSFSDATALAITYSRTLGVDTGEMASKMGEFSFETGMGLRDIAEQFAVISREALLAGFVTKRFYSAVVEVTSGMGFYGVRIEETTKLLKSFDSLLGEAVGTKAFKNIIGQYKDRGTQDRIRDLILRNPDFAQEQFGRAFERQVAMLSREFGNLGAEEIRKILQMSDVDMAARLQTLGLEPEEATRFQNASLVGKAARGDLGAMTRAMPFAGPGFEVALASQATQVFGGRRIDEVLRDIGTKGATGVAEFAALEQVTGKTPEALEELGRLFVNAEGALHNLERIQSKMSQGTPLSDEDRKLMESYRDSLGLYIDEQTKQIQKGEFDSNRQLIGGTGIAIKNALEVVTETSTTGEKDIEEQLTKDQEIASEISKNITGLNEIMEQSVVQVLNNIYGVTADILAFMQFNSTKTRDFLKKQDKEKAEKARIETERQQKRVADAQERLRVAQSRKSRPEIEEAEKQVKEAQESLRVAQDTEAKLGKLARTTASLSEGALEKGDVFSAAQQAAGIFATSGHQKAANQRLQEIMEDEIKTWGESLLEIVPGGQAFGQPGGFNLERFGSRVMENPELVQQLGGESNVRQALNVASEAVASAREATVTGFLTEKEISTTSMSAFQQAIAQGLVDQQNQGQSELYQTVFAPIEDTLRSILKATQEEKDVGMAQLIQGAVQAHDMILPAGGGRPIITDERDTLMAARPGGPLARSAGGTGGSGSVTVNIHGGNQKVIYDTVRRALRATGNA